MRPLTKCTAYTPGPWHFKPRPANGKMYQSLMGGKGELITYFKIDLLEGNASLISAAPELLEALKGLLWLATPHYSDNTQLEHIRRCEEVIAKATGVPRTDRGDKA